MRWFLDRGCPFHPILETSHSGKSRNGKERNSPFCVMSSLSAATVVLSTTAAMLECCRRNMKREPQIGHRSIGEFPIRQVEELVKDA
ncbi:hypothetical protein EVAR_16110_1 [Eumeta japonica]|uniref:Uncharacterized protein n=1 Tax=Eumeta variegata TaxID=151549 RepID=A0A4C1UJI8_EUMVA|nr:hypothetical protein EVAR_16110_1 [Eumeta japonica]